MADEKKPRGKGTARDSRQNRLAAALRANLRRRKEQTRARSGEEPAGTADRLEPAEE